LTVTEAYVIAIFFTDFFSNECKKDAENECREFHLEMPLSEEFDSSAFEHFCK